MGSWSFPEFLADDEHNESGDFYVACDRRCGGLCLFVGRPERSQQIAWQGLNRCGPVGCVVWKRAWLIHLPGLGLWRLSSSQTRTYDLYAICCSGLGKRTGTGNGARLDGERLDVAEWGPAHPYRPSWPEVVTHQHHEVLMISSRSDPDRWTSRGIGNADDPARPELGSQCQSSNRTP